MPNVDPEWLSPLGLHEDVAALNAVTLPRSRQQGTMRSALQPAHAVPAREDLMTGLPEDLRGVEAQQPLSHAVPEDQPLRVVDGEDALRPVRQPLY